MSFNVDALQSRCRKRDQTINNNNNNNNNNNRNEPLVSLMGEAVKSLAGAISDVIESFWTKNEVTTPTNNKSSKDCINERIRDDVMVEVDAIIVYDQTIEDGFVDVALARDVQSTRKKSSRFMNMRSRLPTSSPIDIPKSKIARPERKERHFV